MRGPSMSCGCIGTCFPPPRRSPSGQAQRTASTRDLERVLQELGDEPVPDAELGYRRAPNVRTPCHETTNLATRGSRRLPWSGPKIVFLGDSFVESAACSNDTLTTKVEKLTGIDTLNFGVGGYGVDQIFIHFTRLLPRCDRKDCLFLLGVIQDDLGRMLLAVRTSPKPYFTIRDDTLVLHTEHIHPDALNDFFRRPPERFYLYYFLRGRLGFPIYRSLLNQTREVRQQAVYALSQLIFREMAVLKRKGAVRARVRHFSDAGQSIRRGDSCRCFAEQAFPWWICRDA